MRKTLLYSFGMLASAGLLLSSCSKEDKVKGTLVTRNDFEGTLGWGGNVDPTITTEKAHSGQYSVKVGPQNEYGYTYAQTLGKMSPSKTKIVTISAWIWMPNSKSESSLALQVNRSIYANNQVYYGGINLTKAVTKYKSWQHVSESFTLPDSVKSDNYLKCYLWRAATNETTYADDITISVGE